jgi:hypothetical protein
MLDVTDDNQGEADEDQEDPEVPSLLGAGWPC